MCRNRRQRAVVVQEPLQVSRTHLILVFLFVDMRSARGVLGEHGWGNCRKRNEHGLQESHCELRLAKDEQE